jgi:hypothetical protein
MYMSEKAAIFASTRRRPTFVFRYLLYKWDLFGVCGTHFMPERFFLTAILNRSIYFRGYKLDNRGTVFRISVGARRWEGEAAPA